MEFQNKLKNLIALLPKEIQNHIYEYNVEHRDKMKQVLEDIKMVECRSCSGIVLAKDAVEGNCTFWEEGTHSYEYFCSIDCRMADEYYRSYDRSRMRRMRNA